MKKVLITGGDGKLGRVIDNYLSVDHDVTIFDLNKNKDSKQRNNGGVMNRALLRSALRGHDVVVHLAAVDADVPASDEDYMQVNVMGTWNVFEEARIKNISKVIFMSSVAVYGIGNGTPPNHLPIDEQHPRNPKSSYGLSKLLGENIAERFSRTFNIDVICFRPPYIVHKAQAPALHARSQEIDKAIFSGNPLPVRLSAPQVEGARSYVFAEDVAKAVSLAIKNRGIRWGVFNVSAPDTYSTQPTLKLIHDEFGATGHIEPKQDIHRYGCASMFAADEMQRKLYWKPNQQWKIAVAEIAHKSSSI